MTDGQKLDLVLEKMGELTGNVRLLDLRVERLENDVRCQISAPVDFDRVHFRAKQVIYAVCMVIIPTIAIGAFNAASIYYATNRGNIQPVKIERPVQPWQTQP